MALIAVKSSIPRLSNAGAPFLGYGKAQALLLVNLKRAGGLQTMQHDTTLGDVGYLVKRMEGAGKHEFRQPAALDVGLDYLT